MKMMILVLNFLILADVSVQLLVVNLSKTGIVVANLSDFVFSRFVDFGESGRIGNFLFDGTTDSIYWQNLTSGYWSPIRMAMTFDIWTHRMGTTNWTVLSDKSEGRTFSLGRMVPQGMRYIVYFLSKLFF